MLKQFLIAFAIISLFGLLSCAQENAKQENVKEINMGKDGKTLADSMQMGTNRDSSSLKAWNTVCPVKGGEVDLEVATVQYDGKNYGFCCPGCDAKFKKNPEKYAKNLNEDGTEFRPQKN